MLIFGIAPEPLGTRMSRYFLESGLSGKVPPPGQLGIHFYGNGVLPAAACPDAT
jgi:hypothetical protein